MNILIIEDDRTISALMGRTLTGAGYECGFAYDGEEAEELFDSHPWDLVLLDLMLPKVSGYDLEAVIRRTAPSEDVFGYKGVVVNNSSRTVTKDGEEVSLTVKEFDLLSMLINNRNVALSRRQLYEYVWKEEYYGETRTLDNHIKRIRQKLGYEDVIKTVFGIGYRMEVPEA